MKSRRKNFFFLSRCKCPPTMWLDLDLLPTKVQHSVLDTPSAQATTIPSACSLPLSEELLGKEKAGSWLRISSAECSTGATAAMSGIRMLSYSSFSQHPAQDFTISCLQPSCPGVILQALTAPDIILTFWLNAAAGWEGFQAHPKSNLNCEPLVKESQQGRLLASASMMGSCHQVSQLGFVPRTHPPERTAAPWGAAGTPSGSSICSAAVGNREFSLHSTSRWDLSCTVKHKKKHFPKEVFGGSAAGLSFPVSTCLQFRLLFVSTSTVTESQPKRGMLRGIYHKKPHNLQNIAPIICNFHPITDVSLWEDILPWETTQILIKVAQEYLIKILYFIHKTLLSVWLQLSRATPKASFQH